MDREQALNIVRSYKKVISPLFADADVYLFGSYSKGTAREDSDLDVAVVVHHVDGNWLDKSSALWLATLNVDTAIEPVLIESCHPSPLYEDVLKTGIAV